jgi:hypothetical protein
MPPSAPARTADARRDATPPPPAARETAPESPSPTAAVVRATEPQPRREQQIVEQVAEVMAWVAKDADSNERAPAASGRIVPIREREAERSSRAPIAEDVFEGEPPGLDSGDVTVTVGTIELTVETPQPVTDSPVPPASAAPPTPVERESAPSSRGLTRHYLRT